LQQEIDSTGRYSHVKAKLARKTIRPVPWDDGVGVHVERPLIAAADCQIRAKGSA